VHTIDTNALIYYLEDEVHVAPVIGNIITQQGPGFISTITELELFSFSKLTPTDIRNIEDLLRLLIVIPLDSRFARIAGSLRQEYQLKTADSAVAATALAT